MIAEEVKLVVLCSNSNTPVMIEHAEKERETDRERKREPLRRQQPVSERDAEWEEGRVRGGKCDVDILTAIQGCLWLSG